MSHINQRGYAWLSDSGEHSESDELRAKLLAERWSRLHHEEEQEGFARQRAAEDGEDCYEPDPCPTCGGDVYLGINGRRNSWGDLADYPDWAVGIKCPNPNCEDGYDVGPQRVAEKAEHERKETRRLEMEVVQEMLAKIGARMMRAYEHHAGDESYYQWMEEGRFGDYSG